MAMNKIPEMNEMSARMYSAWEDWKKVKDMCRKIKIDTLPMEEQLKEYKIFLREYIFGAIGRA